jgi:hypothetical protein
MATRYLISLIVAIAIIQTSTARQIPAAEVETSQNGTVISKLVVYYIYAHTQYVKWKLKKKNAKVYAQTFNLRFAPFCLVTSYSNTRY